MTDVKKRLQGLQSYFQRSGSLIKGMLKKFFFCRGQTKLAMWYFDKNDFERTIPVHFLKEVVRTYELLEIINEKNQLTLPLDHYKEPITNLYDNDMVPLVRTYLERENIIPPHIILPEDQDFMKDVKKKAARNSVISGEVVH